MKTFFICIATLLAIGLCCYSEEEVYKVLTSAEGTEMKAWIRKVENDQVTFRRDDGKVFTIPLSKLSADDQKELKKMQAAKPPAPVAEPKVNKRLYPRGLSEMKTACDHIREVSRALKGFTEEERDAIAELNIYRYLSGVPAEVPLDRSCCEVAVKASEGCAKIGELSHVVVPEGKSCNLHQGQANFAATVHGYMEDPGDNNRDVRGHRMWCLHPELPKSGFGCDATKQFFGMWVSNGGLAASSKAKRRGRAPEFHAYPGNGFYPASRLRGNGWSLYPGGAIQTGEVDLKVYELAARPAMPFTAATLPKDAKEVKIGFQKVTPGTGGGWAAGWVVFEPEVEKTPGKIYWVSLKAGSVRIGYVVEFTAGEF